MDNVTLSDILHNGRCKIYPDGKTVYLVSSRSVFRERGWEARRKISSFAADASEGESVENSEASSVARSQRRARSMLRDYALANTDFRYFVTLTLSPKAIDRYDINAIMRTVNGWLDNRVRRKGLKYILVPEHHKDGAIHFHGLVNDALRLVDSGFKGEHTVFNIPEWRYGYTTAIELYGEREKAVGYVCKYIGKQTEKIGGRWYYSGGQLKKPDVALFDVDYELVKNSFSHEGAFIAAELNCEMISFTDIVFKDFR